MAYIVHELLDMQGFNISNHIEDCHNVPMPYTQVFKFQIDYYMGVFKTKYALNVKKFPIN